MLFSELETVPSVLYEFPTGQSTQMGLDRFRISESLFDTSYISNLKVLSKCNYWKTLHERVYLHFLCNPSISYFKCVAMHSKLGLFYQ